MTNHDAVARRVLAGIGLVSFCLAAGCSRHDPEPPLGAQAALRAPPTPAKAAGPPAFVGRWSPALSACTKDAWVLTTDGLQSPNALSCSFDKVTPTDAGYVVYSLCTVGKARAPGRLVFTLTGKGETRSLTVSGGPFTEPMALERCSGQAVQAQAASYGEAQGG